MTTETVGFVQKLVIDPSYSMACVEIGPSPSDVELFTVVAEGLSDTDTEVDLKVSMINTLATAFMTRREVSVVHPDDEGTITSLEMGPG